MSTNCVVGAGIQAQEAPLYCFPQAFQLPGLHSAELSGLLKGLSATVAKENQPESQELASEDLFAITKALQRALAMPSARESDFVPAPVKASVFQTTNGAATYCSSGSARTDLFFKCEGNGEYGSQETIPQELLDQAS